VLARNFPQLPRLLDDWLLERDGQPTRRHYSLVLPVRRMERALVLKIVTDGVEFERELEAMLAFDGFGAVEVLEDNRSLHAMLLARAPGADLASSWSIERDTLQTDQLIRAAIRLAAAPIPPGIAPLAYHLRALNRRDLSLPAEAEQIRSQAATLLARLTHTTTRVSLLHADLHHENLIVSDDSAFVIDPLTAIGDPLYDLAPLLHNPWQQLDELSDADLRKLTGRRVAQLAARLPAEPARVAGWGLVRAAASTVWFYEDRETGPMLDVSLRCARVLGALAGPGR
jgi:streptomycin 6-kinase